MTCWHAKNAVRLSANYRDAVRIYRESVQSAIASIAADALLGGEKGRPNCSAANAWLRTMLFWNTSRPNISARNATSLKSRLIFSPGYRPPRARSTPSFFIRKPKRRPVHPQPEPPPRCRVGQHPLRFVKHRKNMRALRIGQRSLRVGIGDGLNRSSQLQFPPPEPATPIPAKESPRPLNQILQFTNITRPRDSAAAPPYSPPESCRSPDSSVAQIAARNAAPAPEYLPSAPAVAARVSETHSAGSKGQRETPLLLTSAPRSRFAIAAISRASLPQSAHSSRAVRTRAPAKTRSSFGCSSSGISPTSSRKNRPAIGELKPPDALRHCAGRTRPSSCPNNSLSSSPVGIAAQFSFTNVPDRRPLKSVNQRARDKLLASPGLAVNEHRRVRRRNCLYLFQQTTQRRTVPDDLRKIHLAANFVFEIKLLLRQLRSFSSRNFLVRHRIVQRNRDLRSHGIQRLADFLSKMPRPRPPSRRHHTQSMIPMHQRTEAAFHDSLCTLARARAKSRIELIHIADEPPLPAQKYLAHHGLKRQTCPFVESAAAPGKIERKRHHLPRVEVRN